MLGALTEHCPHIATENHHASVTEVSLPMSFIDLSTIVVDSFFELDSYTSYDWEHLSAVLNHETLTVEDLETALEESSKPGMGDP